MILVSQSASAQTIVGNLTHTGMKAGAVAVYEGGNRVIVGDSATGTVYTYDGNTNAEINSVATGLPSILELIVDETRGKVWAACACSSSRNIAVLDAATGALGVTLTLPSPGTFARLAKDESLGKVYVVAVGGMYVFDASTYARTTVPGLTSFGGIYASIAANPVTHEVFSGDSLTKFYIIDGQTLSSTVLEPPLLESSISMTVNPFENKVYISSDYGNDILVFNRNTDTLTGLNLGTYSYPVAYDPVTNKAFSPRGHIIDGATDAVSHLPIGRERLDGPRLLRALAVHRRAGFCQSLRRGDRGQQPVAGLTPNKRGGDQPIDRPGVRHQRRAGSRLRDRHSGRQPPDPSSGLSHGREGVQDLHAGPRG
jgi:hypothetical protein